MDQNLDKEISQYVTNGTDKILSSRCIKRVLEKHNYYDYIINRYTDNSTDTLTESIYRIVHGIEVRPVCKVCGKPIEFKNHRYSTYCSKKCVNSDPEVLAKNSANVTKSLKTAYAERGDSIKAKRAETLKRNFGESTVLDISAGSSPFAYKKVQEIAKSVNTEQYGVDNVFKLPEFHTSVKERSRNYSINLWKERGINIEYIDDNIVKVKNACPIHGDIELPFVAFRYRTRGINSDP